MKKMQFKALFVSICIITLYQILLAASRPPFNLILSPNERTETSFGKENCGLCGYTEVTNATSEMRKLTHHSFDIEDDRENVIIKSETRNFLNHEKTNVVGVSSFLPTNDIEKIIQVAKKSKLKRDTRLQELLELNETVDDLNLIFNDTEFNDTFSEEDYLDAIREYIFPKTWTWILIFFHTVVFIIGLVGNILVCIAVYRNHTMRTVTNYFIVNLAVADFFVILCCLPPSVAWDVTSTWFLGVAMCKIVLYLQTVSVTVSVLTLTFISMDRWYAICFPLKFKSTTGRAKTAICVIWFLAVIFDIPELIVYTTVPYDGRIITIYFTQCEADWSSKAETSWTILKMILLYAIPLAFMTVAYCQIILVLWKSGSVHHPLDVSGSNYSNTFTMNTNTSTEGQLRSRRKAAKMLVAVVTMFAFCYFPVHLLSLLRCTVELANNDFNKAFALISHWLCYANSAVNPVIYNFMSGKFRKEFRRAFDHCCQSSSDNQRGYQMSHLYRKNTEKDSGIASRSHSQCSKRTTINDIRKINGNDAGTIETQNNKSTRSSGRTSVTRVDV